MLSLSVLEVMEYRTRTGRLTTVLFNRMNVFPKLGLVEKYIFTLHNLDKNRGFVIYE